MAKITKKDITAEVKKAWNTTHVIEGVKIAVVAWKNYGSRMIIENEETFDDAKSYEFKPILAFDTQTDLVNYLYKSLNQKD